MVTQREAGDIRSLSAWLLDGHASLAARALSHLAPAPHRLLDGVHGFSLRINEVIPIAELVPNSILPAFIQRSAPKRRAEFVGGRICAEQALREFVPTGVVGVGSHAEPIWPSGIVGSITHNERFACAVASTKTNLVGIGIDSETIATEEGRYAIEAICCTNEERKLCGRFAANGLTATVIFTAKEAFYKAIHSFVGRFVDFDEAEITDIQWSHGEVRLRPVYALLSVLSFPRVTCQFCCNEGMVHTAVFLESA